MTVLLIGRAIGYLNFVNLSIDALSLTSYACIQPFLFLIQSLQSRPLVAACIS
jgi:hypothetical protein